ncbi:MAG: glycoside hydrolase family 43 protein [Woeseiaceae bacterium]|nr:glycoside hydrolase family 43 protein [Woeseiaceae bacterium]
MDKLIRKTLAGVVSLLLLLSQPLLSSADDTGFRNPILRGSSPDPSICRVGDDYYIVNSTFEYFPGLPIHHSTDLVNWELIGHGMHRESQATGAVNLVDVQSNGGIHAPTLRCRDGRFYIITTNVYLSPEEGAETEFVNFVITADDIRGPWSEPHVIDGAPGIDPDLFFDDDGRVWYVGTHSPEKPNFDGEGEIWLQELDPDTWSLTGERYLLWRGACGGVWVEGPHMYKRDGRYYLMVAEGGTSFNHAVMVAVSDDITGPYQSNPRNPILTSRHLSYDFWVNSTGHADLVELPDGRWYMVALGIRGDEQGSSNMGRETHLIPVVWEREPFEWKEIKYLWPVAAPETGRVERENPLPFAGETQAEDPGFSDDFDADALQIGWTFRRVPREGTYSLDARDGHLRLFASATAIGERQRASLLGFRQSESDFDYSVLMQFAAEGDAAEAGISLIQKDDKYLNFTVVREDGRVSARLMLAAPRQEPRVIEETELSTYDGQILLTVASRNGEYVFSWSAGEGEQAVQFATTAADHILAHSSYTGAFLGLYASTNGGATGPFADFDWVRYRGIERP